MEEPDRGSTRRGGIREEESAGLAAVACFDSHCHVQDSAFDSDRDAVLERAAAAGVTEIVVIGADPESADRARSLVEHPRSLEDPNPHPKIWFTAGLHPHEAVRWSAAVRSGIEAHLDAGAVALGEIGLDYHYDHSPRPAQREAFSDQLELASERGLPVIIHSRDAEDDTLDVLDASGLDGEQIVLHCFSGSLRMLECGIERGFYISFSGMVTFKAFPAGELVPLVPADRLLAETDAPYLAPVPRRGKRNEPAWVVHTVAALAALRGMPAADAAALTRANARRFYGLDA